MAKYGKRIALAAVLVMLLLGLAPRGAAVADGEAENVAPFVAVRTAQGGDIEQPELDRALAGLAGGLSPQHVVVLIHGWDTPRYASRRQYDRIARDLRAEFASQGLRVAVVGLQWPSDAGPRRRWLPQAGARQLVGLLGFPRAVRDPYVRAVPRARATGRLGLRRLLFAVHERYPEARVHLFTHSMGAEVALHAIRPQATPTRDGDAAAFRAEGTLKVDVLSLAGADLDEDVALPWKVPAPSAATPTPRLWWLTIPSTGRRSDRDRVLVLRQMARGRRAVGNVGPRLRAEQLDHILRGRRLVFDTDPIPRNHDILAYYSPRRLASLAGAAGELQDPRKHTSPLLETLDRVLATPDDRAALQPYLEAVEPTVKLYALWRLERRYCGDSRHLLTRRLLQVDRLAHTHPELLEKQRATLPCRVVREGIWPPVLANAGKP